GQSFLSERSRLRPPAAYPQRLGRGGRLSLPIWPCSRWGLPCRVCCQPRGELLPHHFTLTQSLDCRRCLFCGTVRRRRQKPSTPRRYLAARPMEPGLSSSGVRRTPIAITRLATIEY